MSVVAQFTVHDDPPEEVVRPIVEGLRRYNESRVGPVTPAVLVITASDAASRTIGGAKGLLLMGWVYVDKLWVEEEHRGGGLGGALLERLESEALARGAKRSVLLSASWQAPEFYKARGYTVMGTFELDVPPGPAAGDQTDYLLVKSLR
jgi:GNAT superfamily N-acetyltransferase